MTGPAPVLPTPSLVNPRTGVAVWTGGVRRTGPLVIVPGRTLDVLTEDGAAELLRYVATIMAAFDYDPEGA